VLQTESRQYLQLGELKLSLQVDRIDQLANGSQLIIDYKTSKLNAIEHWLGARPPQPQLPLYCLTLNQLNSAAAQITGIAFATVHPTKMTFKGLYDETVHDHREPFPGAIATNTIKDLITPPHAIQTHWQQLIITWRQTLTRLSDDFCNGYAAVDPAHPTTCHTCQLQALCRVRSQ
jgi:ATP-dependent helicase/nuclease subunit B